MQTSRAKAEKKPVGLIDRAIKTYLEYRSSLENPQTPLSFPAEWLLDIFNGGRTDSGIRVSEMTALQVGTVYACVNIISSGMAGLPLHVYERLATTDDYAGKRIAYNHPLWYTFYNSPNPEMTRYTFIKTFMCHALLWGNAYAEVQYDNTGQIVALWPRNPARTRPIRNVKPYMIQGTTYPAGTLMYETSESLIGEHPTSEENLDMNMGRRRIILAEDMVHVPGLSLDGRLGQSTVYLARQIIGLSLATEKYGAKFFGNGARPAGILTIPGKLEERAIENLRRSWAEAHGGENQFKVAVLEEGVKFEKIAATPAEGQMLATRQYERSDICAVFNVPLHMVAANEKGGKSNVEQSSIEFVLYCLHPWQVACEMEFDRKCFPRRGRTANRFFPHFDTRRLRMPDASSRAQFYSSGRQWGYLNADDIRELEDMNPIGGKEGKTYWQPTNMQDASDPITPGANALVDFHKDNPEYSPQAQQKHQLNMAKATAVAKRPVQGAPAAEPGPAAPTKPGSKEKPATTPKAPKAGKRDFEPKAGKRDFEPKAGDEFVMRHGTTDANLQDVYRGWGPYDLDDEGIEIAKHAAEFLKDKGIKLIITSPLVRHMSTARIMAEALGAPIKVDDGFKTMNVGMYTGLKRSEYEDEVQYYLDHPDEQIPGGETVKGFRVRSNEAFARSRVINKTSGPVLVITSRSNIAGLEGEVSGADVKVAEPGGVYRLDAVNNLELIFGDKVADTMAGT